MNTVYAVASVPLVWAAVHPRPGMSSLPVPSADLSGPLGPYVRAIVAIRQGDAARARALLDRALARDSVAGPTRLRGLYLGVLGWVDLAAGDTARGLERMQAGIQQVGFAAGSLALITAPLRFQVAAALARRPAARAEGIRRLRYGFDADFEYLPLALLALGEALEASDDSAGARAAYGEFGRLWEEADPALRSLVQLLHVRRRELD